MLAAAAAAFAQEAADHPLVGRYAGSTLVHQEYAAFAGYRLLVGPETVESVEGSVRMTLYNAPPGTSSESVYMTYRGLLRELIAETVSTPGGGPQ